MMAGLLAVLLLGFAIGVGLIFALAGAAHWQHRRLLVGVVGNYRLLPDALVGPVAALLPWGELMVGLAMLQAPLVQSPSALAITRMGAAVGGGLLILFGLAMAINLRRGRGHIDCGCGHAELRQPLNLWLVARNLVLALPLLGFALLSPGLPQGMGLLAAMVAGLAVWLGFHLFNALVALQSSPLSATLLPTRR